MTSSLKVQTRCQEQEIYDWFFETCRDGPTLPNSSTGRPQWACNCLPLLLYPVMEATDLQWSTRNHLASFVHTLHLLDLDKKEDWPAITGQSFGTKANLQRRIQCAEWALYRLFEVQDARLTRDKLKPFFPATTSLKSMNLRAALTKQLTELKVQGVINSHVVLRKTTLDECKGDRFEELLSAFAKAVLRSHATRLDPRSFREINIRHELIALIVAHRARLAGRLRARNEVLTHARTQSKKFASKEQDLVTSMKRLSRVEVPSLTTDKVTLRQLAMEARLEESIPILAIARCSTDAGVALPSTIAESGLRTTELRARLAHHEQQSQNRIAQLENLNHAQDTITTEKHMNNVRSATSLRFHRHSEQRQVLERIYGSNTNGVIGEHKILLEHLYLDLRDKTCLRSDNRAASTHRLMRNPQSQPRAAAQTASLVTRRDLGNALHDKSEISTEVVFDSSQKLKAECDLDPEVDGYSISSFSSIEPEMSSLMFDSARVFAERQDAQLPASSDLVPSTNDDGGELSLDDNDIIESFAQDISPSISTSKRGDYASGLMERTRHSMARAQSVQQARERYLATRPPRQSQTLPKQFSPPQPSELWSKYRAVDSDEEFKIDIDDPFRSRPKLASSPAIIPRDDKSSSRVLDITLSSTNAGALR